MKMRLTVLVILSVIAVQAAQSAEVVADSSSYYMPYPIVFVHGLASDSTAWNTATANYGAHLIKSFNQAGSEIAAYSLDNIAPNGNPDPNEIRDYFSRVNFGDKDATANHNNFENLSSTNDPEECIRIVAGDPAVSVMSGANTTSFKSLKRAIDAALTLQAQLIDGHERIPGDARKVILVGHSTGGLIIREFLRRLGDDVPQDNAGNKLAGNQTYRQAIQRVVFVGTPHYGSPFANYLRYHVEIQDKLQAIADEAQDSADYYSSQVPVNEVEVARWQGLHNLALSRIQSSQSIISAAEGQDLKPNQPLIRLLQTSGDYEMGETVAGNALLPNATIVPAHEAYAGIEHLASDFYTWHLNANTQNTPNDFRMLVGQNVNDLTVAGFVSWVGQIAVNPSYRGIAMSNDVEDPGGTLDIDQVDEGDGVVPFDNAIWNLWSGNSHITSVQSPHTAAMSPINGDGLPARYADILRLIDDKAPVMERPAAMLVRDENGDLRGVYVFELDELNLVHSRFASFSLTTNSSTIGIDQAFPEMYGRYIELTGDHFTIPTSALFGYRPYIALGEDFNKRRDATTFHSPTGETITLGPGQWFKYSANLTAAVFDTAVSRVQGQTADLIPENAANGSTFDIANIGTPPYLQRLVLTTPTDTQISEWILKRNGTGAPTDVWSRELKADTRLIGVCNDVTVTVTFNQPFAQDSVSMYLWNGTDTPKIILSPISGQQNHILIGTIAPDSLAHTKVGVYPLAVSCTGPNPLAPHLDGDPSTIAWYDPVADTYRGELVEELL